MESPSRRATPPTPQTHTRRRCRAAGQSRRAASVSRFVGRMCGPASWKVPRSRRSLAPPCDRRRWCATGRLQPSRGGADLQHQPWQPSEGSSGRVDHCSRPGRHRPCPLPGQSGPGSQYAGPGPDERRDAGLRAGLRGDPGDGTSPTRLRSCSVPLHWPPCSGARATAPPAVPRPRSTRRRGRT